MEKIKTLYIPIRAGRDGRVLHTATVRSDWTREDWKELDRTFPCDHETGHYPGIQTTGKWKALHRMEIRPPEFEQLARWKIV